MIIHRLCISDVGYGSGEDLDKPSGVLPLLHCKLVNGFLIISDCGLPNVLSNSPSSLSKTLPARGEGLPLCALHLQGRVIRRPALKGSAQPQASTIPVVVLLQVHLIFPTLVLAEAELLFEYKQHSVLHLTGQCTLLARSGSLPAFGNNLPLLFADR